MFLTTIIKIQLNEIYAYNEELLTLFHRIDNHVQKLFLQLTEVN